MLISFPARLFLDLLGAIPFILATQNLGPVLAASHFNEKSVDRPDMPVVFPPYP